MSLGTSNRDGGKTSESGHLRALGKIVSGDVIAGLNAVQRAAGINMSVDIQVGDAFVRRSDGTYSHPVFNDAVYNRTIATADGSNPRRDIVVIYIDYGQTPSTAVSNNTNGVVKIKVVNGTPAGSPVDPNAAAIQASVGSGNPYSILARVRVPAGQTTISNSLIDDMRVMAVGINNGGWRSTAPAVLSYTSYSSATKSGVIATDIDIRSDVQVGHRIAVWQSTGGWKYGIVHVITSSAITVFFGQSYTLANEAIYLGKTSGEYAPMGFDPDPGIWKIEVYDTTTRQGNTPTKNVWYVPSGSTCNINLDPGKYTMGYETNYRVHGGGTSTYITGRVTISTTTNTETDTQFTSAGSSDQPTGGVMTLNTQMKREKVVTVASNTTYRLLGQSDCQSTMGSTNGFEKDARIYAYSAYIAV